MENGEWRMENGVGGGFPDPTQPDPTQPASIVPYPLSPNSKRCPLYW